VNFLRRLALQKVKLDDSSHLDLVEIASVPDMLPNFFFPVRAKDLSAPRYKRKMQALSRIVAVV